MATGKKSGKSSFFEVKTPLTASKIHVFGPSKEEVVGRAIKLDLTRSLRGKNLELRMKVVLDGDELRGEPDYMGLVGSYIRRMMRKGADYVEDSFESECKDGKVRIKPFMITRNKVSRAVRNELRVQARKYLEGFLKARTMKEVFSDMITNKVQKEMALKLKKIYPLALCEVRVIEVVKQAKIESA